MQPTADLTEHLREVEARNTARAHLGLLVACGGPEEPGQVPKIPRVAPLRLEGTVVKVAPGRTKGVAITLVVADDLAWWSSSAKAWFDGQSGFPTVQVGDELVVHAIVDGVRQGHRRGRFLRLNSPKIVAHRRRGATIATR